MCSKDMQLTACKPFLLGEYYILFVRHPLSVCLSFLSVVSFWLPRLLAFFLVFSCSFKSPEVSLKFKKLVLFYFSPISVSLCLTFFFFSSRLSPFVLSLTFRLPASPSPLLALFPLPLSFLLSVGLTRSLSSILPSPFYLCFRLPNFPFYLVVIPLLFLTPNPSLFRMPLLILLFSSVRLTSFSFSRSFSPFLIPSLALSSQLTQRLLIWNE